MVHSSLPCFVTWESNLYDTSYWGLCWRHLIGFVQWEVLVGTCGLRQGMVISPAPSLSVRLSLWLQLGLWLLLLLSCLGGRLGSHGSCCLRITCCLLSCPQPGHSPFTTTL
jgi:hypothetical protein